MDGKQAADVLEVSQFISPGEIAQGWNCARSSVDRIAGRAGFTRLCLGEEKNGMVRYLQAAVDAYEASRQVRMS